MLAGAGSRLRCDFEQSGVKVPVNFDGTADHAIRKLVELHLRALRVLRGCSLSMTLFSML